MGCKGKNEKITLLSALGSQMGEYGNYTFVVNKNLETTVAFIETSDPSKKRVKCESCKLRIQYTYFMGNFKMV